jgi:Ca2+-binding RTX toxin-like protein
VDGGGGNDVIDASAYLGTPYRGNLILYGGPGNDRLTGDVASNQLYGEEGDDILYGGAFSDRFYGGPGDDIMYGGDGGDIFYAGAAADGGDVMRGGSGDDLVDYSDRTAGLNLTLGNGAADDGEAGEGDEVASDVENVWSGSGDDVLVGTSAQNYLRGGAGNDEIHGGGGADGLDGEEGDDILFGEAGADGLGGGTGNDVLDGGAGADRFFGAEGDDLIINDDGVAETVDCGAGTMDDAEPDPLDTFSGCEL